MSSKNMEMMKKFLEKKKEQEQQKQSFEGNGNSGTSMKGAKGMRKLKTRGANNKV